MTLITGTTGTIGRTVVDHLADANTDIAVRGMSRDPDDESSLAEVLDEFVAADYRYHETLRTALDGVEEAFLLTPDGPEQVAYKSDFIYEAERAGVAFVANLSVRGRRSTP